MEDRTSNVGGSWERSSGADARYLVRRIFLNTTAGLVVAFFSVNAVAVESRPIFLCKGDDGRSEITDTKKNSSCKSLAIPGFKTREIAKLSDSEAIAYFKRSIEKGLVNPESVVYRNIVISREREHACGQVNSKNSFGEYIGFAYFAVRLEKGVKYSDVTELSTPEYMAAFCF